MKMQLIWRYAWMWTPLWSYAYETTQLILTKQHNGFYVAAQWIWSSAIEAAHLIWSCAHEARQWTWSYAYEPRLSIWSCVFEAIQWF